MEGLQGIFPILSRFEVSISVDRPSRAAASAASMPAWPPPMTTTSAAPAKYPIIILLFAHAKARENAVYNIFANAFAQRLVQ